MKDKDKKKKQSHPETQERSCFHVVDDCGCIVGSYCCEGPDMKSCKYENCC